MDETVIGMGKLNNDYITVDQYVKYLKKVFIKDIQLDKANEKFEKALNDDTYGRSVIKKGNIIYIRKTDLDDEVKLYKNSVDINFAVKAIIEHLGEEINSIRNIGILIMKRCNAYYIKLIHGKKLFISKDDLELISKKVNEVKEKKCIPRSQFLNMINNTFRGIEFSNLPHRVVTKFIRENNLEYIDRNFIGNFYPNIEFLYPQNTVDKVMEYLINEYVKNRVKLINITLEEYFALKKTDFENEYRALEKEDILNLEEPCDFINNYAKLLHIFESTNIKIIWIQKGNVYVSKKEFYEYVDFRKRYVIANPYFKNLGIRFVPRIAENNGMKLIRYKNYSYIKKEDIDRYTHISNYNSEISKVNSLYDRVKVKIKYYPNKNKYPIVKEYLMDFTKHTNKNVTTMQYAHSIYAIYNILLDNMKRDLESKNEAENNKLFSKAIRIVYESNNRRKILIQFVNYLIDKKNLKLNKLIDIKEKGTKKAYTKEQFITLLSKLLEIVNDENKLKKMYRNWNLSSAVSYVFMHYCLSWRRMDLISQLSKPNFKIISADITDGEAFITWLEDGNKITYEMAQCICRSLEEETERLRKKAYKNNMKLSCIISDALVKEVATLLCINEANRQIHIHKYKRSRNKEICFNTNATTHKQIQILFKENFNIDVEEILGSSFDNIRMNKGFLTLVKEKAEELNLFAYHYAEVLRGHTPTRGSLAETTKIYLDKNVAKASVTAFATGTMGSVAYTLLQLIDEGFESKSAKDQIEAIQNLNMTPYTIEKNLQVISNKISAMRSEIQKYFKQGGYKEGFLQDLLYGQTSYGIEEKTKCLIKITKKDEFGISRIRSMNYSEEKATNKWCPINRRSCIGCQYMIALRYFIYEFEKKFNQVLHDLESAESQLDKDIVIESINELYIPVLNDLGTILGSKEVSKVIDTERYKKLVETI